MKIKDLVNELNKYDENTEVFVNDEEGHERIGIKFDVSNVKAYTSIKSVFCDTKV